MRTNPVVLVIAHNGYQPIEYSHTRRALEEAGFKILVASDKPGTATSSQVEDPVPAVINTPVDCTIHDIDPANVAGIFLIGGPGALEHLDNEETVTVMRMMMHLGKPFGAICISPRILARAGLLSGKHATGWDGDHKLAESFKNFHVTYIQKPVVIDGTIVTAHGPAAAFEFGQAISKVLSSAATTRLH